MAYFDFLTRQRKKEGTSQTYGQLLLKSTDVVQQQELSVKKDLSIDSNTSSDQRDKTVKIEESVASAIEKIASEDTSTIKRSADLTDRDKANILVQLNDTKDTNTTFEVSPESRESSNKNPQNITDSLSISLAAQQEIGKKISETYIRPGSKYESEEEINSIVKDSSKIDLLITAKSKFSKPIEYNTLYTPDIEVDFVYNFYIDNEENITSEEDPSRDPIVDKSLKDIPRYVVLRWNKPNSLNKIKKEDSDFSTEVAYNRNIAVLSKNSKDFINKQANFERQVRPWMEDGLSLEVIDIHKPQQGFESTVNKNKYVDTNKATVSLRENPSSLTALPYLDLNING